MAYGFAPPRDPTEVLGRRVVAYVVDAALALIVLAVALALVHHDHYLHAPKDACAILKARSASGSPSTICRVIGDQAFVWKRSAFETAVGLGILVQILNFVALQAVAGASVGKQLLGLRVVDDLGRKAGFGRVLVRWLFLILDAGIFLVGLITVFATHPHRRVGDLVAGTYVVATESMGRPIGVASALAPYAAGVPAPYATSVPVGSEYHGRDVPGWGSTPEPAPPAPPPPPAPWNAPPATPPAAAPTPPPPPWSPPPAPAPALAPAAAPQQWSTAAPPQAPPPAPTRPAPFAAPEQPATTPAPKPEAWWDTAIPAEPPADEEPQP